MANVQLHGDFLPQPAVVQLLSLTSDTNEPDLSLAINVNTHEANREKKIVTVIHEPPSTIAVPLVLTECSICYETPTSYGIQENCNHIFCGDCLLQNRGHPGFSAICPLCRTYSLRALILDTLPNDWSLKSTWFPAVQVSHWSSSSLSSEDRSGATPVVQRTRAPWIGEASVTNSIPESEAIRRRHLETRRHRLLRQARRTAGTQRRWTTTLEMTSAAEGRVLAARLVGQQARILSALQDYTAMLASSALVLQSVLFDARTALSDARSFLRDAEDVLRSLVGADPSGTQESVSAIMGALEDVLLQDRLPSMASLARQFPLVPFGELLETSRIDAQLREEIEGHQLSTAALTNNTTLLADLTSREVLPQDSLSQLELSESLPDLDSQVYRAYVQLLQAHRDVVVAQGSVRHASLQLALMQSRKYTEPQPGHY